MQFCICIADYTAYRKDRDRHGSGVFILVRNTIPSHQIHTDSSIEIVWVRIHTKKNKEIVFGSMYSPPHFNSDLLEKLHTSLLEIKSNYPHAHLVLGGDHRKKSDVS